MCRPALSTPSVKARTRLQRTWNAATSLQATGPLHITCGIVDTDQGVKVDFPAIRILDPFDSGFTFLFLDSAGAVTGQERAVMDRIKSTDVASVAYQGMFLSAPQIAATLPLIKQFNPTYLIPNHHDEIAGQLLDMATYPLFMAIRDEMPRTKAIAPLYRAPMCFNTVAKEVFVGSGGPRASNRLGDTGHRFGVVGWTRRHMEQR